MPSVQKFYDWINLLYHFCSQESDHKWDGVFKAKWRIFLSLDMLLVTRDVFFLQNLFLLGIWDLYTLPPPPHLVVAPEAGGMHPTGMFSCQTIYCDTWQLSKM